MARRSAAERARRQARRARIGERQAAQRKAGAAARRGGQTARQASAGDIAEGRKRGLSGQALLDYGREKSQTRGIRWGAGGPEWGATQQTGGIAGAAGAAGGAGAAVPAKPPAPTPQPDPGYSFQPPRPSPPPQAMTPPGTTTTTDIQRDPRMEQWGQQQQERLAELQEPVGPIDTSRQKSVAYGDIGAARAGQEHLAEENLARRGIGGAADTAGGQIMRGIGEAAQTRMARAGTEIDIEAERTRRAEEQARQDRVTQTLGLGLQGAVAAGAGERDWARVGLQGRGQDIGRELGMRAGDITMRGQDIGERAGIRAGDISMRGQDIGIRGQDIAAQQAALDREERERERRMGQWRSLYGGYGGAGYSVNV